MDATISVFLMTKSCCISFEFWKVDGRGVFFYQIGRFDIVQSVFLFYLYS